MCRLLLFVGWNALELDYFLRKAPNSMKDLAIGIPYLPGVKPYKQLYARNPETNVDGYGLYFIDEDDHLQCKKSKFPVYGRLGLHKRLMPFVNTYIHYLMAFVRNNNFKERNPNRFQDVQPYRFQNYLFVHNGGFNTEYSKYTEKLSKYIDPNFLQSMKKINIDSKWLFGVFVSCINLAGSVEKIVKGVEEALSIMYGIKDQGFNISLNIILSDLATNTHIAVRYRTCKQLPPTLYYNKTHPHGYFVASEPLDKHHGWKLMNNHLIIIRNETFYSCKLYPEIINC